MFEPTIVGAGLYLNLREKGHIKIGGLKKEVKIAKESKREWHQPEKYDHFVITTMERDSGDRLVVNEEIMKSLPKNPKKLHILFLFDDPKKNLLSYYALYAGTKKICWGDGLRDGERRRYKGEGKNRVWLNEWDDIECDVATCKHRESGECKMHGVLTALLVDDPTVGGVYRFRTTGTNSVRYLYSTMALIQNIAHKVLSGIPLLLTVQPETKTDKTHKKRLIYTVGLEFDGTIPELRATAIEAAKARSTVAIEMRDIREQIKALPDETETEERAIAQEFSPDTQDAEITFEKPVAKTTRAAPAQEIPTETPEEQPKPEETPYAKGQTLSEAIGEAAKIQEGATLTPGQAKLLAGWKGSHVFKTTTLNVSSWVLFGGGERITKEAARETEGLRQRKENHRHKRNHPKSNQRQRNTRNLNHSCVRS
jgi:hypothetical protein